MIRFGLFSLCVLVALVFQIKHEVMKLNQKHQEILTETQSTLESFHVLKAEWVHLNNPKRLQILVKQYLPNLQPIKDVLPFDRVVFGGRAEIVDQISAKQELDALLNGSL